MHLSCHKIPAIPVDVATGLPDTSLKVGKLCPVLLDTNTGPLKLFVHVDIISRVYIIKKSVELPIPA